MRLLYPGMIALGPRQTSVFAITRPYVTIDGSGVYAWQVRTLT